MSALEVEHNYVPDQLVDQLVKGYDALNLEIKVLDEQRRELENRLSWAKQQVCGILPCSVYIYIYIFLSSSLILHDDQLSSRPVAAFAARNDNSYACLICKNPVHHHNFSIAMICADD
jgi:hypothetical protein